MGIFQTHQPKQETADSGALREMVSEFKIIPSQLEVIKDQEKKILDKITRLKNDAIFIDQHKIYYLGGWSVLEQNEDSTNSIWTCIYEYKNREKEEGNQSSSENEDDEDELFISQNEQKMLNLEFRYLTHKVPIRECQALFGAEVLATRQSYMKYCEGSDYLY